MMLKFFAAALAALLFAAPAAAQTPADVLLIPTAGVYTIRVQTAPDAADAQVDTSEVCIYQVEPAPRVSLACMPAGPDEVAIFLDLVIQAPAAPDQDIHVRAVARDASGNASDDSPNKGIIDFTRPGAPLMILSWLKDRIAGLV